jgi:hypothetical protein
VAGGWRGFLNKELHNFILFAKYNYNEQVQEDEIGRAYSTNEGKEE